MKTLLSAALVASLAWLPLDANGQALFHPKPVRTLADSDLDLSIWVPPPASPHESILVPILVLGAIAAGATFVLRLYSKPKHTYDVTIPCRIEVYELDGLTDSQNLVQSLTILSGPAFTNYWDAVHIPMKDRAMYKVVCTALTNSIP